MTSLYVSEIEAPFSNLKHDVKGFWNCADKSGRCEEQIFAHTPADALHSNKDSHETILSKENMSLRVACLFSFCAVAPFPVMPVHSRLKNGVVKRAYVAGIHV